MFIDSDPTRAHLRHYNCDFCGYYHVTSMSRDKINKYLGTKPLKYAALFRKYMNRDDKNTDNGPFE